MFMKIMLRECFILMGGSKMGRVPKSIVPHITIANRITNINILKICLRIGNMIWITKVIHALVKSSCTNCLQGSGPFV